MPEVTSSRSRLLGLALVALAFGAALAGCSSDGNGSGATLLDNVQLRSSPSKVQKQGTLFVQNQPASGPSSVTIYSATGQYLRKLEFSSTSGFTSDTEGHLFVGSPRDSNDRSGSAVLSVYADAGAKPVQTLHQPTQFYNLTLDPSGNLYTGFSNNRIYEYAASNRRVISRQVIRKLQLRKLGFHAESLAVDPKGDLATAQADYVAVFAPGKTKPYWTLSVPNAGIRFDDAGNLYVASGASNGAAVLVYAPNASTPSRVMKDSYGTQIAQIEFDGSGNLFVLTYCVDECGHPPAIAVFPAGATEPQREITKGFPSGVGFMTMSVAPSGDLYVATSESTSGGDVLIYPAGKNTPSRTVNRNIDNPVALSFSP
jgi:hypothetical protein